MLPLMTLPTDITCRVTSIRHFNAKDESEQCGFS